MGSFRASISLLGNEYDVLATEYQFNRSTDSKGKPSSGVYGGRINIKVESTADTTIVEAMINSEFKPIEGIITYKKTDEDAKMKEVEFKNAYIVHFKESLAVADETPMCIEFTVSAEQIIIGQAQIDNRWPKA